MKQKVKRALSMLLAAIITASCIPLSALAAIEGGGTVTLLWDSDKNDYFDEKKNGSWVNLNVHECYYTQEDGSHGTSYCMDHGKAGVHQLAPSANQFPYVLDAGSGYTQNPQAVGVIMRGSGRTSLQSFLNQFPAAPRDLTEDEYRYATQVALWAALGQICVEGTGFTNGNPVRVSSEYSAQGARVLKAAQELLKYAATITKNYYVGTYINHGTALSDTGNLDWSPKNDGNNLSAEDTDNYNGKAFYVQTFKVASASFVHNYALYVGLYDAIPGTMLQIVKDGDHSSAAQPQTYGSPITVKPIAQSTTANANGAEYYAVVKLWVPKEAAEAQNSHSMRLQISGEVENYDIFVGRAKGHESSASYQKYLISGLLWKTLGNSLNITWGTENTGFLTVKVKKNDENGAPLAGATFQLKTASGKTQTATTNEQGEATFSNIDAGEASATVVETVAPEGYALNSTVFPVTFNGTQDTYHVTVADGESKKLVIRKIDADTNESLADCTIKLTHISTGYVTTVTTLGDGRAEVSIPNDKVGGWRAEEVNAPAGYELDGGGRVQTFHWDGQNDVTLTFQNHRRPGIMFVKRDAISGRTLPGAVIEVRKDGQKVGDFTTGEDGTFEIPEVTKGHYEFQEKQAPAGFLKTDETVTQFIDPDNMPTGVRVVSVEMKNYQKPQLKIIKYDQSTNQRLAGITFEVYRNAALLGTYQTDDNGEILLNDLEPGTYLVKEVSTDNAHVVNSTPQQIEITADQTAPAELVFFNALKPGMHLVKVDSEDLSKPLPNVRFQISLVGGSFSKEFVTDENGEIGLSALTPGAYAVRELAAPDGYLMDDAVRVIQLNPDENAKFVFTNTRKPELEVIKYDPDNKLYLGGATFRIAKIEDGTHYLDRVTDENGKIQISGLEPGVYSVREIAAPAGYVLNETEYHVELFPGKTSQLVVNNYKKPSMKILKTDALTGEPLAGVTFKINKADSSTVTTATTGADGTALIEGLDPGVYQVTEQSVPDTHMLDKTPQLVTLTPNVTAEVRFQNYPKSTLTVLKTNVRHEPIPGAVFSLYRKDGTLVGDYTTDAAGKIVIPTLPDGIYKLTEKSVPAPYILDPTPIEIEIVEGRNITKEIQNKRKPDLTIRKVDSITGSPIKGTKMQVWYAVNGSLSGELKDLGTFYTDENGEIRLPQCEVGWYRVKELEPAPGYAVKDPDTQELFMEADKDNVVTFENIPKSAIVIWKKDATTNEGLGGYRFRVRYLGGTSGTGGTVIGEYTTSPTGAVVITGLDAGTYVIEEIETGDPNHIIDTTPQTVYLSGNDQDVITVVFSNQQKGSLILKKVNLADGNPMMGVQFKITDIKGTLLGPNNGIFITDADGLIRLTNIDPKTTIVAQEIKTLEGFVLNDQPQTIQIDSATSHTLTFYNVPKGTLVLRKLDKRTGKPLSGVTMKITDGSGAPVGDSANGEYVTSENGTIAISGLKPGMTIRAWEVKTKDDSYVLDTTPQTIVIQSEKENVLTFYNQAKCTLILKKLNAEDNTPLSGVTFQVTDGTGAVIGAAGGEFVTDESGLCFVSGLVPGTTVVVREVRTKDGFILDSTPKTIQVEEKEHTLTFYNKPIPGAQLTIRKTDPDGKPLAGVTMQVTDGGGAPIGADGGKYVTGSNGEIVITAPDIKPGMTIKVWETATVPGYDLDPTPQTIRLKENGEHTLTFINQPTPGAQLTIRKTDPDGKPLAGVTMQVTDGGGAPIGADGGKYVTGSNGEIVITAPDIKPGMTIKVWETATLPGYDLDPTPQTILLKENGEHTLTFINQPTAVATLIIRKVSAKDETPLAGAHFKITQVDGTVIGAAGGAYTTNSAGEIVVASPDIQPGMTIKVWETRTIDGYLLDATPQTLKIEENKTHTLTFRNEPIVPSGLVILKRDKASGKAIKGVSFSISKMNGENVGTYRTDKRGMIVLPDLAPGWYLVTETEAEGYLFDPEPHRVEIKKGETTTLELFNQKASSILLRKVDAVTGKGIPNVTFLLYDSGKNPIGQYVSDQNGYVYLKSELTDGKYFIRELAPAPGYLPDEQLRTIYVKNGETTEILWKNTPVQGQIQITKKSADYNSINGFAAGTLLAGATFEIYDRANNLVDTIKSDARGLAISKPLPLGRYTIRETVAPPYYAANPAVIDAEIEFAGQIVRLEVRNSSTFTNVSVQKRGYAEVVPGQSIKYTFGEIANRSTISLSSFYWRDTLPTDAVRLDKIITGAWNTMLSYKVVYKTNLSGGAYRTLADNLRTDKTYTLAASPAALGLASGEYVTETMFVFGTVPSGFAQVETPYIYCTVLSGLTNGYQFTNKTDVGGLSGAQWIMANDRWVTAVIGKAIKPVPKLPRTGY